MYDIGKRAVAAIEARAKRDRKTVSQECIRLGMSINVYSNWKRGGVVPSGYFLQQMAMGGYDVHYILTGVKK
jgi:transcriptional regulator with XRE-family HTH domain